MASRKRNGQFERDLEQAALDTEAVELRRQRKSFPEIAAIQGCSVSTAWLRFQRALAAVPYEAVEELRRIELESLDEQERRLLAVQEATHYKVDHGKLIEIVVDGKTVPMIDDAPVLAASAAIVRIKQERYKLTGSYAPTKTALTVITEDAVDAEIRRLEEELGANGADAGDHRGTPREAPALGRAPAEG